MARLTKLLSFLIFITSFNLSAFTVFSYDSSFNWDRPTDIFVIGYGKEVGTLFVNTAVSRARKHRDALGPARQILFIWAREKDQNSDAALVERLGFKIIESNDFKINMDKTLYWLDKATQITSLHFIGHSSAWNGFGLQHYVRFNQDPEKIIVLKDNFAPGAYIYLHGCNTGFLGAPEFSRILQLPVLASLTSTDFQQLHNNGSWYWNNRGQYPSGGWDSRNDRGLRNPRSCSSYACYRMKTNNHPYNGVWGKYEIGLPFHKAFCNFDLTRDGKDTCYRGMWNAILTWPSTTVFDEFSSRSTYKTVVSDFLCPKIAGYSVDKTCLDVLRSADRGIVSTKKFAWGAQMNCSFKECDWKTKNVNNPDGLLVTVFIGDDVGNLTLAREYQHYMDLFDRYSFAP